MAVDLADRLKTARKRKGWSLEAVVAMMEGEKVDPSTINRMEKKGTDQGRSGDPKVWGELWRIFGLPLAELYEGLGLPVPKEIPTGIDGEIWSRVRTLPEEVQKLVLSFVIHAPEMYAAALPTPPLVPASPVASSQGNVTSNVKEPAATPEMLSTRGERRETESAQQSDNTSAAEGVHKNVPVLPREVESVDQTIRRRRPPP